MTAFVDEPPMLANQDLICERTLPAALAERLPHWLHTVPLYQPLAAEPAVSGSNISSECFRRLPFITKVDIRRDFPRNFLPRGAELEDLLDREEVELEHTSGTSEARTPLLLKMGWWKEQEELALRLNPVVACGLDEFPAPRRVVINSPVCSGEICYTGVPSLSERTLGNSRYAALSRLPFLWGETDLARMAAEATSFQPQFLDVDPVYGVVFALYCERKHIRLPSLQFIICSYEFVSRVHRKILQRVFGVPVFDLYGSTETGHLLMERGSGCMRPSLETAYLEVVQPDAAGIGELVVTTLTNDYMPLIRYRIGDLVKESGIPCRTNYTVHGRVIDALHLSGRRITTWQIDQCFSEAEGLTHYQLAQTPEGFLLRFVPDPARPFVATESQEVRHRLAALLSVPLTAITLKQQSILMPEGSGKFRLVSPLQAGRLSA